MNLLFTPYLARTRKFTPEEIKKSQEATERKRTQRRYNIPVIGYFRNRSIMFPSILEAEKATGISYHLIFENCIGKIRSANGTFWEYVDGKDWIKYKSQYIRAVRKYTRYERFNGLI